MSTRAKPRNTAAVRYVSTQRKRALRKCGQWCVYDVASGFFKWLQVGELRRGFAVEGRASGKSFNSVKLDQKAKEMKP